MAYGLARYEVLTSLAKVVVNPCGGWSEDVEWKASTTLWPVVQVQDRTRTTQCILQAAHRLVGRARVGGEEPVTQDTGSRFWFEKLFGGMETGQAKRSRLPAPLL